MVVTARRRSGDTAQAAMASAVRPTPRKSAQRHDDGQPARDEAPTIIDPSAIDRRDADSRLQVIRCMSLPLSDQRRHL